MFLVTETLQNLNLNTPSRIRANGSHLLDVKPLSRGNKWSCVLFLLQIGPLAEGHVIAFR